MRIKLTKIIIFIGLLVCIVCPIMLASCEGVWTGYDSVSEARNMEEGEEVSLQGYYVGVAQEGINGAKEILVKDTKTDDIIAVRGVTYGTWPNVGYKKGDLINISGVVKLDGDAKYNNKKKYIQFTKDIEKNPKDIKDTIVENKKVSYKFNNITSLYSQDHLVKYFKDEFIEPYSYVKLVGTVYYNLRVSVPNIDQVKLYRIHMNNEATDQNGIVVEGSGSSQSGSGRYLTFRENVLVKNLGEHCVKYVNGDIDESGLYNVNTIKSDELICLVTGVDDEGYQLVILDESWIIQYDNNTSYNKQDALIEVAKAFYNQGSQIRYNQTMERRNINPSPEDATSQNIIYADCSSFVTAVYYEAFGKDIVPGPGGVKNWQPKTARFLDYAQKNKLSIDVAGYYKASSYTDVKSQKKLLEDVRSDLKVGDVVVYRREVYNSETNKQVEKGHCFLYLGNNAFIHCVGSDYVKNDKASTSHDNKDGDIPETTKGSIYYVLADEVFNEAYKSTHYLFYKGTSDKGLVDFCVLRPMALGATLTSKTRSRMNVRMLEIEKTVNIGVNTAVHKNETLTYSISVKNKSQAKVINFEFEELLDSDLTAQKVVVKKGGNSQGQEVKYNINNITNVLSFNVGLEVGESVLIELTCKVKSNPSGNLIESKQTKVGGFVLPKVVNTISNYSKERITDIVSKAKSYVGTLPTQNPVAVANKIYKDVIGKNIYSYSNENELMGALFEIEDASEGKATVNTKEGIYNMVAPNLYGGNSVSRLYYRNKDLVRLITVDNLSLGDIIVAVDNSGTEKSTVVYIYVGGMQLVKIEGAVGGSSSTVSTVTMSNNPTSSDHILVTLPAYDTYAILRPSMVG